MQTRNSVYFYRMAPLDSTRLDLQINLYRVHSIEVESTLVTSIIYIYFIFSPKRIFMKRIASRRSGSLHKSHLDQNPAVFKPEIPQSSSLLFVTRNMRSCTFCGSLNLRVSPPPCRNT